MQRCFSLKGDLIVLLFTCCVAWCVSSESHRFCDRVQDAYTMRCCPQVSLSHIPLISLPKKMSFSCRNVSHRTILTPLVWTEKYLWCIIIYLGLGWVVFRNLVESQHAFVFVHTGSWSRQWHNKFCSEHHQYRNKQRHWQPGILFLVKNDLPQIVTKILLKLQIVFFFLTDVQDGFCRERRDNFRRKFPWRIPG